jgi:hypothetical protein
LTAQVAFKVAFKEETMVDKRESDTIRQVALNMDGLTTKNIFRALIECYRAGYRHAEDDYNEAALELSASEGAWIDQDEGLANYETPHAQLTRTRN